MRKGLVQALVIASLLGMSAASATAFPSPSKNNRDETAKVVTVYGQNNPNNPGNGGNGSDGGGQNNQR